MSYNPFDELVKGINDGLSELSKLHEKNQETIKQIKEDPMHQVENNAPVGKDNSPRELAEICLSNKEVLLKTLLNRTKKNKFGTTDAAVFLHVLTNKDKEEMLHMFPDNERHTTITELEHIPDLNKQTTENIIFNIQAEYYMRLDGEEMDIDLFSDLF